MRKKKIIIIQLLILIVSHWRATRGLRVTSKHVEVASPGGKTATFSLCHLMHLDDVNVTHWMETVGSISGHFFARGIPLLLLLSACDCSSSPLLRQTASELPSKHGELLYA